MKNLEFRADQMFAACPFPVDTCGKIAIQVKSEEGKSKWMEISEMEFKMLEILLCEHSEG